MLEGDDAAFRITDSNLHQFRSAGVTVRARLKGIPELSLMTPSGATAYWLLEFPESLRKSALVLGTVGELSVGKAKFVARNLLESSKPQPSDGPMLREFLPVYWARHGCRLSSKTQKGYHVRAGQLLKHFGEDFLGAISHISVLNWHAELSIHSPGSANEAQGLLRSLINHAKRWGFLGRNHPNPCDGIPKNRQQNRNRSLSAAEVQALKAAISSVEVNCWNRLQIERVRMTLLVGARPGEIRTLRWSEIVFTEGAPSHIQLEKGKTGGRCIELTEPAREILMFLKGRVSSPYVFPSYRDRRKPTPEQTAAKFWRELAVRAQLPKKAIQYWLRHTFGSNVLLSGGTLQEASDLLGHRNPKTTRRYIHILPRMTIEAGDRIGSKIAGWLDVRSIYGQSHASGEY